ncbi:ABC transporter substrate-binding protein [Kangiella sediminilitoris]|nr:ABC transporter substrate binding protein [Kangiella sediminilitoris]
MSLVVLGSSQLTNSTEAAEPLKLKTVKVNILSAFSTPQERELLYSFKRTLLNNYSISVDENLIFWERQSNWQQQLEGNQPDLIIVIGSRSYQKVASLELNTPMLALMLNKSQFENLKEKPKDNVYAITHSQPIVRFIQLAKSLNAYQAQVGSFISPKTKNNIQQFSKLASFYNLSYRPIMVDPKLTGRDALKQLENCCSVMIMESDCVFRPGKVRKSILINAYRQRMVVIAHSESVLKEGAMLTLSTRPHDIGEQAAKLYQQLLSDELQEPYQFPDSFAISINRKVARLLGYEELTVGRLMQKVEALQYIHHMMINRNNQTP